MSDPRETGPLYSGELLDLLVQLQTEIAGLRAENMALKDEIRRLKGLPPRPKVKPSGMEASSKRGSDRTQSPKRRGSSRAIISEERHLGCVTPAGARFLGRTSFIVQDVTIGVRVIHYSRDRWRLPD